MTDMLVTVTRLTKFLTVVAKAAITHRISYRKTLEASFNIGIKSLPVLLIISVFVGSNLSVQGYDAFGLFGGQDLVGMFVALAGVREVTPILVAAMVAAKAGTEMASQLAVMRIREEIDAIEVMALSPEALLIVPKILGIVLVLPALTMIAIFTMVCSALAVAVFQLNMSAHTFLTHAVAATTTADLFICNIKAFAFGLVIVVISTYFGFNSKPGAAGVGSATNSAVVVSAVLCAIANTIISVLFYS